MNQWASFFYARFFIYWFAAFLILYASSFLLFGAFAVTRAPMLYFALQVHSPLILLVFSYLYFRHAARTDWSARIITAIVWIVLTILLSAVLIKPVYGFDWTAAINLRVLNSHWIDIAAIIIGGFLAAPSRPSVSEGRVL